MTSKSQLPSPQHPLLEVSILFEPHRRQHELLQAAYASLVPQSRRRVASGQEAARAPQARAPQARAPQARAPQARAPDLCRERKAP